MKEALIVRWTARIVSLAAVLVVAKFLGSGEELDFGKFTAREWVAFALFPVGVCLGLLVAWFREGLGAAMSLACVAAIFGITAVRFSDLGRGAAFLTFATPGCLFLVSVLMHRRVAAGSR